MYFCVLYCDFFETGEVKDTLSGYNLEDNIVFIWIENLNFWHKQ